jgi:hypothetical protein
MAIECGYPTSKFCEAEHGSRTLRNCFSGRGAHYTQSVQFVNLFGALGSKTGGRDPGFKTVPGAKKLLHSL